MQNVLLLGYYLIFLMAVIGMGRLISRWLKLRPANGVERFAFALTLGSVVYSYYFQLLGAVNLLYASLVIAGYVASALFFAGRELYQGLFTRWWLRVKQFRWQSLFEPSVFIPISVLFFILFPLVPHLFLYPASWDVVAYHLPLPKFYLSEHSLPFTRWFDQTGFPIGIESLYGFGEALKEPRLSHLIHFTFLLTLMMYVLAGVRYLFSRSARWLATFLLLFQPMLYSETALSAFTDYPLALFTMVVSLLLVHAFRDKKPTTLVAIFILLGFLPLVKYSGLMIVAGFGLFMVLVIGQMLWQKKDELELKKVPLWCWWAGVVSAIPAFLWGVRNILATGNPFYPFYNSVFHGLGYEPGVDEVLNDIWANSFVIHMIQNFRKSADTPQDYINLAAVLFLIAGVIAALYFIRHKRLELRVLSRFTLLMFVLVVMAIGPITRYIFFVFPAFGLLIGTLIFEYRPLVSYQSRLSVPILAHAGFALLLLATLYVQIEGVFYSREKWYMTIPKRQWLYFLDPATAQAMLYQQDNYRLQHYAVTHLDPRHDKVLQLLDNRIYYLLDIPSAFANTIAGGYFTNKADRSVEDVYRRIKADGYTHVIKLNAWGAHPVMRQELFNGFMNDYVTPIATEAGVTLYQIK